MRNSQTGGNVVFPKLRERLVRFRVELIDIDLRWGIMAEQAESEQVLGLCLGEIDRCRPFFLGFLGYRYGGVLQRLLDERKVTSAIRVSSLSPLSCRLVYVSLPSWSPFSRHAALACFALRPRPHSTPFPTGILASRLRGGGYVPRRLPDGAGVSAASYLGVPPPVGFAREPAVGAISAEAKPG